MNIKHIFFDLDHTLWDTDYNSQQAFKQCFEELNIQLKLSDFLDYYVPLNESYWDLFTQHKMTKEELKYKCFRDTFDYLKYSFSDAQIDELSTIYFQYLPQNNHLIKGAKSLLKSLSTRYKLHIITNGFLNVSYKKLKLSSIYHYFEQIVTSDCVGGKKPDAKVFKYALEKAQAKPNQSIMIGDNYKADVLGAEAVGIKSIWFDYKKQALFNHPRMVQTLQNIVLLINEMEC